MKPAPFEYHAPTTLGEALDCLRDLGEEAKVIAGGQSLVPMMALRLATFEHLVDLGRVAELRGIAQENGSLVVKAMTTQATVEREAAATAAVPLLGRALPLIGHFQIRNRGTIGGSIAHADSASELPAVALALDAEFEVASASARRTIPAASFFQGAWTTALEPDEILVSVRFPIWSGTCGFAVEELARRHGDFAIAGAAVAVEVAGDAVRRAGIALFGMASTPVRASKAEAQLVEGASPAEAGQAAVADLDPPSDIHGSAAYRRHIGAVMVERALERALAEARHG